MITGVHVAITLEALKELWVVTGSRRGENAGNIYGKNLWAVVEQRAAGMQETWKKICARDDC